MSESPISLRDETGIERFRGTQSPGGGSQPAGVLASADFLFTEQATPGVYTASLDVLATTSVLDIFLFPLPTSPWAASSALLSVGDSRAADAYYHDVDLVNGLWFAYDPADPQPGANLSTLQGYGNTYVADSPWTAPSAGVGVRYATDDTITMSVDTTAMNNAPVAPSGVLLVKVIYFAPATAVAAIFA